MTSQINLFGQEVGVALLAEVIAALIVVTVGLIYRGLIASWLGAIGRTLGAMIRHYWTLSTIRMIVFNRDRGDYAKGFIRGPKRASIPDYISSARQELLIVSVSFITGTQFDKVEDTLRTLLVERRVAVTISLISPEKSELLESVARTQGQSLMQMEQLVLHSIQCLFKFAARSRLKRVTV